MVFKYYISICLLLPHNNYHCMFHRSCSGFGSKGLLSIALDDLSSTKYWLLNKSTTNIFALYKLLWVFQSFHDSGKNYELTDHHGMVLQNPNGKKLANTLTALAFTWHAIEEVSTNNVAVKNGKFWTYITSDSICFPFKYIPNISWSKSPTSYQASICWFLDIILCTKPVYLHLSSTTLTAGTITSSSL